MEILGQLIKKLIKEGVKTRKGVSRAKREIAKEFGVSMPSNIELLKEYHKLIEKGKIKRSKTVERILRKKPIRSLSGIINVSVLTKPYPCPGKCIFCPTQKGMPKSYVPGEPAADRAKTLNFDPYLQTKKRIEQLKAQGHPTDKIELRIVGGTWSYYPKEYQTWFIKKCFEAANGKESKSLAEAQKINEKAERRIVGISIETRPDFVTKEEILRLRKLGVTMVELGVQTLFDDVLKKCKTGLTVKKISKATKLLKDAGFKVLYQMMPNLPGSNPKKDLRAFEILLEDQRFKPDWLKIYPCVVCKNTELFNLWQEGKYNPYTKEQLIELLIEIKKNLPYWIRLTRVFRDIPPSQIVAGVETLNLRQIVKQEMEKRNLACKCIRCREVRKGYPPSLKASEDKLSQKVKLFRQDYRVSDGKEIFLSFENENRTKLYSLLRLRIPSHSKDSKVRPWNTIPVLQDSAIIREIQTFGLQLPINFQGRTLEISPQHKGLGKKLIKKAEKIVYTEFGRSAKKEFGLSKIAVIAGVGVREYFRTLNYQLKQTYMIKKL